MCEASASPSARVPSGRDPGHCVQPCGLATSRSYLWPSIVFLQERGFPEDANSLRTTSLQSDTNTRIRVSIDLLSRDYVSTTCPPDGLRVFQYEVTVTVVLRLIPVLDERHWFSPTRDEVHCHHWNVISF